MRLRRVKNAEKIINDNKYVVKDPLLYCGEYKQLFANNNPIRLEIGMGKGQFLINMAIKYPNINFIGIEKQASVLVRAVEKVENLELNNLLFINSDANKINEIFVKEIELIYLNFSDPWPKKKHAKRRLTSINFLKKYDNIFLEDKIIIMKTDNRHLFEGSIVSLNNYEYLIEEICLDLHQDQDINNIMTEYEEKFISLGFPIYKLVAKKTKS